MTSFSGQNLTCQRGDTIVFAKLSFHVGGGQVLLLHGANGSGKTSLLRVMAGLLPPRAGALDWQGEKPLIYSRHWIGTANPLKPDLTVAENLNFWSRTSDTSISVTPVLDQMNMSALSHKLVRHLSAGQKRRANLCRLLLSPRPLWLLDEPETGLDADNAHLLHDLVTAHTQQGGIAVIASHRRDLWSTAQILTMEAA